MPLRAAILTATLALTPACAHSPTANGARGASTAKGPRVAVTGLVLNGVDSHPVGNARVAVEGGPPVVTATDGSFRLEGARAGRALIHVGADGYRDHWESVELVDPATADPDAGPANV